MDINLIEQTTYITAHLKPFLPALLGYVSGGIAGGVLQRAGEDVYNRAEEIWARLRGKRLQLDEAAEELAKNLDDTDAEASFRFQLRKLLEENQGLAEELQNLFPVQPSNTTVVGDRNITVTGSTTRSIFSTGDNSQFTPAENDD